MKNIIFSIYDQKAKAYLTPFFAVTEGLAIRMFSGTINTEDNYISKNPEDFTLYKIGEFDDSNGTITPCDPEALTNGLRMKEAKIAKENPTLMNIEKLVLQVMEKINNEQ